MSASTPLYNLACTAVDGYLDGELDEAVARRELRPRADAALKRAAQAALDRGQTTEESGEVGTWLWPVREACEAVVAQGLDAPIGAISAVCGTSSRLAEPVLDGGMGSVYENEVGKLREMAKAEGYYDEAPSAETGILQLLLPAGEWTKGYRLGFYPQVRDVINRETGKIFSGETSVEDALKTIDQEGDQILERFAKTSG